jgi:hypothetical protein
LRPAIGVRTASAALKTHRGESRRVSWFIKGKATRVTLESAVSTPVQRS